MKAIVKIVGFTIILFCLSCSKDTSSVIPPIPNGDFELWSTADLPENWQTNSCPLCTPQFQTYIVQKDSNAYNGMYAAKFIDNHVYAATASNKFNLSVHPTNLIAHVRCQLYGKDTVSIKIKLFNKTLAVDSGQWYNSSTINNYIKLVIPISQHSTSIDAALISIKGGHQPGLPVNTTVFWVDDLILSNY